MNDEKIIEYFKENNCEILDMKKCKEYLNNGYICNFDDILNRFCENNDIKCPLIYLDEDYIYNIMKDDYIKIGLDIYFNKYFFEQDNKFKDMIWKNIIDIIRE